MARVHLDRIKQRYGWTGGKYEALMRKVVAAQAEQISDDIISLQKVKATKNVRRIKARTGMQLKVPEVLSEAFPKRSIMLRKAAERGKLLTDSLRGKLAEDLRGEVLRYMGEGKPLMQGARGEKRGRMNPELVNDFESRIRKTFSAYTRRDPEIGVPANVRAIATTEVRSAINVTKGEYAAALVRANPGKVRVEKRWKQHPELAKNPRPSHRAVDGKQVAMGKPFRIPLYERIGTVKSGVNKGAPRWRRTGGYVEADHPHAPGLPVGEVVGCNCEVDYVIVALTPKAGVEKSEMPVGHVSHRADGDYKKVAPGDWEKVTEPESEKTIEGEKPEKKLKYTPEQAKEFHDSGELPEGWYVHGRRGRQDLETGFVLQFSKDWNVADGYAGKNGSVWMVEPASEEVTFDATDYEACEKLASQFFDDYENGALQYEEENMAKAFLENNHGDRGDAEIDFARELNPKHIVESAVFWDGGSEIDWFYRKTGKLFIKTNDGAVALDPSAINKIKVPS
jgi:hypothetical protein